MSCEVSSLRSLANSRVRQQNSESLVGASGSTVRLIACTGRFLTGDRAIHPPEAVLNKRNFQQSAS